MTYYYRGFSEKSACVFDKEEGFVAQSQDKVFDMSAPETARIYLEDHLVWANHHIASPLISTSSEWKAIEVAYKTQRFWLVRGHFVETFVATIQYASPPSNAYKMLPAAARLEAKYTSLCNDPDEWIFTGRIPLKFIVEIRRYAFDPSHGGVIDVEVTWNRSMASPHSLMRSECSVSGQRLQGAIISFTTAGLKTVAAITASELQRTGSLDSVYVVGQAYWMAIKIFLRLLWEAWFHETNGEGLMSWNSSVRLTTRWLMGPAQGLLALYWESTSTPTAPNPLVKKDIWKSTVESTVPESMVNEDLNMSVECGVDGHSLRGASLLLMTAAAVLDKTDPQRSVLLKHSAQDLVSALCKHVENQYRLALMQEQSAAVEKVAETARNLAIEPELPEHELVHLMKANAPFRS